MLRGRWQGRDPCRYRRWRKDAWLRENNTCKGSEAGPLNTGHREVGEAPGTGRLCQCEDFSFYSEWDEKPWRVLNLIIGVSKIFLKSQTVF